jgi:hypothetical protein
VCTYVLYDRGGERVKEGESGGEKLFEEMDVAVTVARSICPQTFMAQLLFGCTLDMLTMQIYSGALAWLPNAITIITMRT